MYNSSYKSAFYKKSEEQAIEQAIEKYKKLTSFPWNKAEKGYCSVRYNSGPNLYAYIGPDEDTKVDEDTEARETLNQMLENIKQQGFTEETHKLLGRSDVFWDSEERNIGFVEGYSRGMNICVSKSYELFESQYKQAKQQLQIKETSNRNPFNK